MLIYQTHHTTPTRRRHLSRVAIRSSISDTLLLSIDQGPCCFKIQLSLMGSYHRTDGTYPFCVHWVLSIQKPGLGTML
ncbi:hypothetical protein ABKN59_002026 [Abortiporus biennis]